MLNLYFIFSLLVSMAPLSNEIRPVSGSFPPHLGPAIPEISSIWFKMFLYHVTSGGPPTLLLAKGRNVILYLCIRRPATRMLSRHEDPSPSGRLPKVLPPPGDDVGPRPERNSLFGRRLHAPRRPPTLARPRASGQQKERLRPRQRVQDKDYRVSLRQERERRQENCIVNVVWPMI